MILTSKLDILNEGRSQGMLFAHKIVKAAQDAGKDPVAALEHELRFRKRLSLDVLVTEKELEDAYNKYRLDAVHIAMAVAMIVLWDVFGFGGKRRLPRFMKECNTYMAAIAEGSLVWDDITTTLAEKCGMIIDITEDFRRRKK